MAQPKSLKDYDFVPLAELKGFAESFLHIHETKVSGADLTGQYLKMTGPFAKGLELVISGRVMLDTHVVNKKGSDLATSVYIQAEISHKVVSQKIPVEINYADYKVNILTAVKKLKEDLASGAVAPPTHGKKSEKKLEELYEIPMFSFDPFLQSLAESVRKYGSLTPAQENALKNAKERYTPQVHLTPVQLKFLERLQTLPTSMDKKEQLIIRTVYAKSCKGQAWTDEDRQSVISILKKHGK